MKTYLVNALSLNMLDIPADMGGEMNLCIQRMGAESTTRLAAGAINAIGHAETAAVVGAELFGSPLPANRVTVKAEVGDELFVAQYVGPRLPEGATSLPEGARVEYFRVIVGGFDSAD